MRNKVTSTAAPQTAAIVQMPLGMYVREGESQRDRVVQEVMAALFERLPATISSKADFKLSDGTKCWVKAFHEPKKNSDDEMVYGFDVKFAEGGPLSHLEFSVRCSGWERALPAPGPSDTI